MDIYQELKKKRIYRRNDNPIVGLKSLAIDPQNYPPLYIFFDQRREGRLIEK